MSDQVDFNTKIVQEFRANGGRVGAPFAGMAVVLVHHKGRRSGVERVNPLVYQKVDSGWAVFASFAGSAKHPDWYLNLIAEPRTRIEVGAETLEVIARDTTGAERDQIFEQQTIAAPIFAEYQVKAGPRVIPVVVFEPAT
ncbi:MAG TPA: nitroreductase/quinone reductase family protein [Acidimicrobiales bacterium]